jgi:hypothetical protein
LKLLKEQVGEQQGMIDTEKIIENKLIAGIRNTIEQKGNRPWCRKSCE